MSVGRTGTSDRPREGVGTLKRFRVKRDEEDGSLTTYVILVRANGQEAVLTCDPDLSKRLLDRYGWRETTKFISVSPIIGALCRYRETGTGMLTHLDVVSN